MYTQADVQLEVFRYVHTHTYIHTMEYYSAIKKDKVLPFAATWMDSEGIILSEKKPDRER